MTSSTARGNPLENPARTHQALAARMSLIWFKIIARRTSIGLSPVSYTFAGVILFVVVVVVVVVSHVVQIHPEKDLSRVVPSKLYV